MDDVRVLRATAGSEDIAASLEAEISRTSYPSSFPVLPEIPGGRYVDEVFYALEVMHVWKKSWLVATHVSDLPEMGSYRLFDRLGLSIIVSCAENNVVRAFHNVCRHRGAPLVLNPSGKAKRFICPYHSWAYTNDGKLSVVTEERDFCIDRDARSLIPVRCEQWHGLIFINLDENAEPLSSYLRPIEAQLDGFPFDDMVVKRRIVRSADCDWKAMRDNFSESYHIRTLHANSVAKWLDSTATMVSNFKNGHVELALKRKIANHIAAGDIPSVQGLTDLWTNTSIGLALFPNTVASIDPCGFPIQLFWPDGPGRSIMELILVGVPEENVNEAYWDAMCASVEIVLGEDMALLSKIQASLNSGFFTGMTLGYQERGIYWYHEEIDRRIGADNLPDRFRVEQVMSSIATMD